MTTFCSRAALVMAVSAAAVASLAGCGSATPTEPPTAFNLTSAAASNPTSTAASDSRTGPSDPQVGVDYKFDLYTHCGIRTTRFSGQDWQATAPRPEPARLPGPDGLVSYTGYTAGTMTLVGHDLLRFVITDSGAVGQGQSIDFAPWPVATPPPLPCA